MRPAAAIMADASTCFCIAGDHPALPGHFPGAPVIPGALLLAEGLRQLELHTASPIQCRRIQSAKFLRPVPPGVPVMAKLSLAGGGRAMVEFFVEGTLVAQVKFVAAITTDHRIHG